MKKVLSVCFLVLVTTAALAAQDVSSVLIKTGIDDVKAKVVSHMSSLGASLDSDTPYQQVFTLPTGGWNNFVGRMMVGNIEDPRGAMYLMYAPNSDGGVKVTAREEVIGRGPYGEVRHVPLNDRKHFDEVRSFLENVKAQVENTHPNSPRLGLSVIQKGQKKKWGAYVYTVDQQGPARDAGLRPGDRLLSVNGEDCETISEFLDKAYTSLEATKRVTVAGDRDGKPVSFTLVAEEPVAKTVN